MQWESEASWNVDTVAVLCSSLCSSGGGVMANPTRARISRAARILDSTGAWDAQQQIGAAGDEKIYLTVNVSVICDLYIDALHNG